MMTIDPADRRPLPRTDNQDPALFGQTPSQTVGPFFHYGLPWKGCADLVAQSDLGARPELIPEKHYVMSTSLLTGRPTGNEIELTGRVLDGEGVPVPDAMIEIWQADAAGRYSTVNSFGEAVSNDPHFIGFGRAATDEDGRYRFRTIMPGPVAGPGGVPQAPHIAMSVFARGVLKRLATRLYFEGADLNGTDVVLALIPPERRDTVIARQERSDVWSLDLHLQGDRETVFFDL